MFNSPIRKPAIPQWGRSFVKNTPFAAQRQQLVRLDFPSSRSITVYLTGSIGTTFATRSSYLVTASSGGISLYSTVIDAPVCGTVKHFVADSVTVEAIIEANTGIGLGGQAIRVAACAAQGSPVDQWQTANVASLGFFPAPANGTELTAALTALFQREPLPARGWVAVTSGLLANNAATSGYTTFRVPEWSNAVQIASRNVTETAMAFVHEYSALGTFQSKRPLSDYLLPQPLDPDTYFLLLEYEGTGLGSSSTRSYSALVQFRTLS